MKTHLAVALCLLTAVASAQNAPISFSASGLAEVPAAQDASNASPAPPPPAPVANPPANVEAQPAAAAPVAAIVSEHSVGVHIGANVGLFSLDIQSGRFYGFAAANVGVPLLSNGSLGAFVLGLGASFALSSPAESMWYFDLYGMALPGWSTNYNYGYGSDTRQASLGLGVGAGIRYLHRSGFVFGAKLPIFGVAVAGGQPGGGTAQMVSGFYLSSAIALPMLSIGYRF